MVQLEDTFKVKSNYQTPPHPFLHLSYVLGTDSTAWQSEEEKLQLLDALESASKGSYEGIPSDHKHKYSYGCRKESPTLDRQIDGLDG